MNLWIRAEAAERLWNLDRAAAAGGAPDPLFEVQQMNRL
jgi:hypothetical protein